MALMRISAMLKSDFSSYLRTPISQREFRQTDWYKEFAAQNYAYKVGIKEPFGSIVMTDNRMSSYLMPRGSRVLYSTNGIYTAPGVYCYLHNNRKYVRYIDANSEQYIVRSGHLREQPIIFPRNDIEIVGRVMYVITPV